MLSYPRVALLLFVLIFYGITLDISASTEMVTPSQGQTTPKQSKPVQRQQDKTYTKAHQHPVSDEDCWFEITKEINALRATGRVLVVTDIDKTLLFNQRLMQEGIPDIIRWLRSADNVDLIALTARSAEYSQTTQQDLQSLGLSIMDETTPSLLSQDQQNHLVFQGFFENKSVNITNNVISTTGQQNKVWALNQICKLLPKDTYQQIIVIEDLMNVCELIAQKFKPADSCPVSIKHYTRSIETPPEQCQKHRHHRIPDKGIGWGENTTQHTYLYLALTLMVFLIFSTYSAAF